jgi:hypothetical protein
MSDSTARQDNGRNRLKKAGKACAVLGIRSVQFNRRFVVAAAERLTARDWRELVRIAGGLYEEPRP